MHISLRFGFSALGMCFVSLLFAFTAHAQATPPPGTPTDPTTNTAQLRREGIFGCSSSVYGNIGSLSAIGGVYVPVNDAAVTLNTGYLVWKECVLDGTTRRVAEGASSQLMAQSARSYGSGRGGRPQFVQNQRLDLGPEQDAVITHRVQDPNVTMCQPFRTQVQRAVVRQYYQNTRRPAQTVTCTLPGTRAQQEAFYNARDFSFQSWFGAIQPSGNPVGAYGEFDAYVSTGLVENEINTRQLWDWGNGTWSRYDGSPNPLDRSVITPGYVISRSMQQMLGSGFEQLQNANEIDQVVSSLWGGLTTQLITDTRGLIGLTQSINGRPSYLDQLTGDTSAGIRNQAVNAALAAISGALTAERTFFQAKEAVANAITSAISRIRAAEAQCWNTIIPAVQARAQQQVCTSDGNGGQTCTGGNTQLRIATSTVESQQVIDTQLQTLATSTIRDLRASEAALQMLQELAASVANSASVTNQRAAIERLDTMIANRQLHTPLEAQSAVQQRDTQINAINSFVEDTLRAWAESTDPNIGWCNVNNPDVIEKWFNAWRI